MIARPATLKANARTRIQSIEILRTVIYYIYIVFAKAAHSRRDAKNGTSG